MAPWTPAQITTALWLDAADASTFTLSGAAVDQWSDKSGNARHAMPPGTKPARESSGLNGMGSVLFSAAQDVLQTAAFNNPAGIDGVSLFVVMERTGIPVSFPIPLCKGPINTQWSVIHQTSTHQVLLRNDSTSGNTASGPSNSFLGTPWLYSGVLSNAAIKQYSHGAELSGSAGATTRSFGSTSALIIGGAAAAGNQFQGRIGEIIVIHADVTTTTRQLVEGYLAHKWGLSANLPADHPFKNAAPQLLAFTGVTRDKTGALAARTVTALRESDQTVVATTTSDPTTGGYEIITPHEGAHTLIFSGEADRNAIVYSGVMPS